jgi:molecular chaperone DnaK
MRDGNLEVLPNAYGEHTTASVVAFADDASITVGNAAKANIIHDPCHTISSSKRLIGRYYFSEEVKKAQAICAYEIIEGANHGVRIKIREEEFSLPEISAMIVREMKQVAEAKLGEGVTKAVVTVPAYFNDNQRQATKDAGKIAGVEVLRILNEPTAAALAYGFGRGLNQRVAVYDLGGGTFDISVLEIGKDVFEVLATCGDTFLGGDDFDDRIIDLLADELVAKQGINPRNDPYALEKLKVAAEQAKKSLSVEEEVDVRIPDVMIGANGETCSLERKITRPEFASLVQDLIQRTFKVCDEAMQQSDLTTRDLDGVILVGGPTRLPVIRQAVENYFQQEPKADVDPDEVVAMGAAIHAASLVNAEAPDSVLLDVTPLDLCIGLAGGLAEPVIERNTPVPIEQTRRFTTFQDYQESVKIKVFQGDSRQTDENEMLGQFEFSGFEKARRGDVQIDVTFEINADGIVNVTAANPETGETTSTSITLSSGLSAQDMEQILEEDRTARVHTADLEEPPPPATAPVASAPLASDDERVPLEDTEIDLLQDDEDIDLLSEDDLELFSTGADLDQLAAEADMRDAVSNADLGGSPDEAVPMGDPGAGVGPAESGPAKPVQPAPVAPEPKPDRGNELFDTAPTDFSVDEDEIELE